MLNHFNHSLLLLARQYRARSQKNVAKAASIDQGYYSRIENGLLPEGPSPDVVHRIAATLDFPASFFYQPDVVYGLPMSVHPMHRKKANVGERALQQLHAELNIRLFHLRRFLQAIDLEPQLPLPWIDVDDGGGPENIARAIRTAWMLPRGPIHNLTQCIERAGVLVVWCDFSINVDGVTLRAPDLPPCVFLNRNTPADRMRFSLAHELGHIVMHRIPTDDIENEANAFARELLMPATDIRKDFAGRVTLQRLIRLKAIWHISIQALLYQARFTDSISDNQSAYLWRQISRLGWRTREPAETDFPYEEATVFPSFISMHIDELGYTRDELSELVHSSESDLAFLYRIPTGVNRGPNLRVIK